MTVAYANMADGGYSTVPSAAQPAMVRFDAVSKQFGGTLAVNSVTLDCRAGTVHAVTGENGAGKSTLMKMLSGVHRPDAGKIVVNGDLFYPRDPRDAQAMGVSTIYQELNLIPNLTVAENLFFGREPSAWGMVQRRRLMEQADAVLREIGLAIDPRRPAATLTIAEQQFVEIAKGLSHEAGIYIFDEPTAALNSQETERLFQLIERLRTEGKLIFYISHRLDEIFRLSDAIAVMKDGRLSAEFQRGETDQAGLIRAMVGRDLGDYFPRRRDEVFARPRLKVSGLTPAETAPSVDFQLHEGEILGLAGLEGQGQRDIIRALVGLQSAHGGQIEVSARPLANAWDIVSSVRAGIGFVPEDRKTEGLFLADSVEQNVALGLYRKRRLLSRAQRGLDPVQRVNRRMRLKSAGLAQAVGTLSGGNQQKVMLGRWLVSGIDVLVIEEPTRGVDVGAKAEIYAALREFCDLGGSVLITSSEMNEIIGLCDRILVVRGGRIAGQMTGHEATEERVLHYAITDQGEQGG